MPETPQPIKPSNQNYLSMNKRSIFKSIKTLNLKKKKKKTWKFRKEKLL